MKILEYRRPADLEEAYMLLNSQKKAVVMGGGLFLRMQKRTIPLVIDLQDLKLDYLKRQENIMEIGAMTPLRKVEVTEWLPEGLKDSVMQIAGVGVRNMATVGGSICGRYPFSDINTALLALDATLNFCKTGQIRMKDYMENGLGEKDILLSVSFKEPITSQSKYYKKVYTDFSLVNISLANDRLVVGARPGRGVILECVDLTKTPEEILSNVEFGDDFKASGEYRRALAETLLEDLIKERRG